MTSGLAFIAAVLGVLGLGELMPERPGRRPKAARLLVTAGHMLRRRLGARAPASLQNRIAAAGLRGRIAARDLMAAKLAAATLGGGAGLLLAATAPAPGRLGLALLTAGPVGGFLAPDAWLG